MRIPCTLVAIAAGLQLVGPPARAQQACAPDTTNKKSDPFSFADFTWLNGNARTTDSPITTPYFTGEFRADVSFIRQFNNPIDHTLVGTSESGRTSEVQLQQLGIGGDFHCGDVRGGAWSGGRGAERESFVFTRSSRKSPPSSCGLYACSGNNSSW